LSEGTGAPAAQVVRAYLLAREVFGHVALWQQIEALDNQVPDAVQAQMLIEEGWLTARATTWFLRSRRLAEPMAATMARLQAAVETLAARLAGDAARTPHAQAWVAAGVPPALAARVASALPLLDALDIAEVAEASARSFDAVCELHGAVGRLLGMQRLRQQIDALPGGSYWSNRAKSALGDDLAGLQRALTQQVLGMGEGGSAELIAAWTRSHAATLDRAHRLLSDLAETKQADLAMLSVALRELRALA
jgi:glutamate dehydrogenase